MKESEIDGMHLSPMEIGTVGMRMDPVSKLAWDLLRTSSGRSIIGLQTAEETVGRCFDLARIWYERAKAASPGPVPTKMELAESDGRMKRVFNRHEFYREKMPEAT